MGRAWARVRVVWGDTTERQPRTCELTRAVARSTAVAVRVTPPGRGPFRSLSMALLAWLVGKEGWLAV